MGIKNVGKRFENGLVLGKFYPFSLGHKYLMDTAISQCSTVFIMICSLQSEIISGEIRYNWIKETYKDNHNVRVIWCDEELPQHTDECKSIDDFYNKYWCPAVYSRINKLDVIFTSENYGDEFAEYLGIKHELVDLDRKTVPISGTIIRENVSLNWNYLPKIVQNYFMKKILIVGTESTGKSTLTKLLAEHYKCEYVEEYGRTYDETIKPAKTWTVNDYEIVAQTHYKNIENKLDKLLIIDTDAITTKLFGEMYIDNFSSEIIEEIINKQQFDLILFLNTDVQWVNDGTRDFEDRRLEHFNKIKNELSSRNLNYKIISGSDYGDRLQQSISYIDNLIYKKS